MLKITQKKPSSRQIDELSDLFFACKSHDGFHLSSPLDADLFFFAYDASGKCLTSAIAVYQNTPDEWECVAFTRPEYRRQGHFSNLLASLCEAAENDSSNPQLFFLVDPSCPDALAVMRALEAQLVTSEHAMEREISQTEHFPESLSLSLKTSEGDCEVFDAYNASSRCVGSCSLWLSKTSVCLFDVEILEELRGQGFGKAMMFSVLSLLQKRNIAQVQLQVSGDNVAAFALYQKTGFTVKQTLSYYLY